MPGEIAAIFSRHGYDAPADIRVGGGWGGLVDAMLTELRTLAFGGGIDSLTERYAGLRVGFSRRVSRTIDDIVTKYQLMSLVICEFCGKDGDEHRDESGWLKTLCADCAQERAYTKGP